jgi:hypothetical protein
MWQIKSDPVLPLTEDRQPASSLSDEQKARILADYARLRLTGFQPANLEVRDAGAKGLGVFATDSFARGAIIEYCHVILLGFRHRYTHDPALKQYCYWLNCSCKECKSHGTQGIIALGFGSIYNSADSELEANTTWRAFGKERLIVFIAKREIVPGEEILTWWGQKYYDNWCKPASQPTSQAQSEGQ